MIAGPQYFDSWTLEVSLRKRKKSNKVIEVGGQLQERNLKFFSKAEGMGEKGKALQSYMFKWAGVP